MIFLLILSSSLILTIQPTLSTTTTSSPNNNNDNNNISWWTKLVNCQKDHCLTIDNNYDCILQCLITEQNINRGNATCIAYLPSCIVTNCQPSCNNNNNNNNFDNEHCSSCIIPSCISSMWFCLYHNNNTNMLILPSSFQNITRLSWQQTNRRKSDLDDAGIFLIVVMLITLLAGTTHGICYNRRYAVLESTILDEQLTTGTTLDELETT
jgi:hypothetical protein